MKQYFRDQLHNLAEYIEIILALIIAVVIAISVFNTIVHIIHNPLEIQTAEQFHDFLSDALSLIVGIEFLKMIVVPTSDNVIETLLFAVSRQIILDHSVEVTIVGIISVALLFIIRKYLFVHFEQVEKTVFRASTRLAVVNKIADVEIPIQPGFDTLGLLADKKFKSNDRIPRVGSVVEIGDGIALRIEKLNSQGKPSRIELIKDINEDTSS